MWEQQKIEPTLNLNPVQSADRVATGRRVGLESVEAPHVAPSLSKITETTLLKS